LLACCGKAEGNIILPNRFCVLRGFCTPSHFFFYTFTLLTVASSPGRVGPNMILYCGLEYNFPFLDSLQGLGDFLVRPGHALICASLSVRYPFGSFSLDTCE